MNMKTCRIAILAITISLGILPSYSYGQNSKRKVDIRTKSNTELISDFRSNDWAGRVTPAKEELESRGAESIPEIVKLLDSAEMVKLKNTMDLIYPGAETFYGHGWVVDYDVDWVAARAGWLLEDLTFRDFGFQEGVINHDEILNTVIMGKSESFIADLKARLKGQDEKKQVRILAAQKAKDWWQSAGKIWNRFDGVVKGLNSTDLTLQYRIFQWLRNGETKCDGLTLVSFDKLLLPEIKRLSKSSDENIRKETEYLLEDNSKEKWWYRRKLQRDHPDTYTTMELK